MTEKDILQQTITLEEAINEEVKSKMKIKRLCKDEVILIPSLVKEGISNREIASRLCVHERAIDKWIVKLKTAGYKFPYRKGNKSIKLEK